VKTDRFSSLSFRTAAVLLAGVLVAARLPAGQIGVSIGGFKVSIETPSKKRAKALAASVEKVQQKFGESRRALHAVRGPRGEAAYARQDVADLIASTETDLDQAIAGVEKSGMEPLRAWSADEIQRVREKLDASAGRAAALPSGLFAPRVAAVVASLGALRLPWPAAVKAAVPQQAAIPAEKADGILDQVGEVVGRIFLLASHDDLAVKLSVCSTPAPRVKFSFWPQGNFKGSSPDPTIIQTNGKKDHVLRGLYRYEAAWKDGAVTQVIRYPSPAGAPAARMSSERLDLVKDTGFFCCQFKEGYCRHVDNEKECRP
jgi:hypothetical protein